jgi:hypothetical protein
VWLHTRGGKGSRLLLIFPTRLTEKANLCNGLFKIWKGRGTRPPRHHQLKSLIVRHPLDTAEVGHRDRHRSTHTGTATDHDPVVCNMRFDPTHCSIQQERLGLGIFKKWDLTRDDPTGRLQCEFCGDEEQRADLHRWLSRVIDIPDQEILGNHVHNDLSIRAVPTRSRENQALSRCSRFHTTVILARRYRRPLYKEPA